MKLNKFQERYQTFTVTLDRVLGVTFCPSFHHWYLHSDGSSPVMSHLNVTVSPLKICGQSGLGRMTALHTVNMSMPPWVSID